MNGACLSILKVQGAREDVFGGVRAVLSEMASRARLHLKDGASHKIWKEILVRNGEYAALNEVLTEWSMDSDKPLVLLTDD